MRKDTAQVETREISDADLDNVSGGLLGPVIQTVAAVDAMLPPLPSVGQVTGLVQGVTGLDVTSVTGVVGL